MLETLGNMAARDAGDLLRKVKALPTRMLIMVKRAWRGWGHVCWCLEWPQPLLKYFRAQTKEGEEHFQTLLTVETCQGSKILTPGKLTRQATICSQMLVEDRRLWSQRPRTVLLFMAIAREPAFVSGPELQFPQGTWRRPGKACMWDGACCRRA